MQRSSQGTASRARLNCARFHLATFRRGRLSIPRNTGFPLLEAEQTPPLHFPRVSVRRINESALVPRGKNVIQRFEEIETRHLLSILFHIYYPIILGMNWIIILLIFSTRNNCPLVERKKKPIDLLCAFPTEINIYFHFFGGGRNRSMRWKIGKKKKKKYKVRLFHSRWKGSITNKGESTLIRRGGGSKARG